MPKVVQSSQALAAKILLANNLHLIKKGAFQKSANFSRPTNHAQVSEPIRLPMHDRGSGTEGTGIGLMGEGFILLTRGYGFMGGVPPPF